MRASSLFFWGFCIALICSSCAKDLKYLGGEAIVFEAPPGSELPPEIGMYKWAFHTSVDAYQGIKYRHSPIKTVRNDRADFFGYDKENIKATRQYFFFNEISGPELKLIRDESRLNFLDNEILGQEISLAYRPEQVNERGYEIKISFPAKLEVDLNRSGIESNPYLVSSSRYFNIENPIYTNAVPENEQGVFVILSYRGDVLNMSFEEYQDTRENFVPIRRYAFFPDDDGELNFPSSYFEGIPRGGHFYLFIYRSLYLEHNPRDFLTLIEFDNSAQLSLYRK